jgi:hypothetical protein
LELKALESQSEVYCRDVFNNYLESLRLYEEIVWKPKPFGIYSPPDYVLTLDDNDFYIEITETRITQEDGFNQRTAELSRVQLIKHIEREAKRQALLRGLYLVHFMAPWCAPLDKPTKCNIKREILFYLHDTISHPNARKRLILFNDKPICEISKVSDNSSNLEPAFSAGGWSESPEHITAVRAMVQDAIDRKIKALSELPAPHPRILLLCNSNLLADADNFLACRTELKGMTSFHTIFIIMEPNQLSFTLNSEEDRWRIEAGGPCAPPRGTSSRG